MSYEVSKEAVWVGELEDRPGALAEKLEALTGAGANLEFIIARRAWNKPGAVAFVAPVHGAAQTRAARSAGFEKALGMHTLRIAGPDRSGLAADVARRLADGGVNLRGWSAASLGHQCAIYFAFATDGECALAQRILRREFAEA